MARPGSWPNRHQCGRASAAARGTARRGAPSSGRGTQRRLTVPGRTYLLWARGRDAATVRLWISGGSTLSVKSLSTPQLCALWRKSSAGLHGASSPAARAHVVATRGVLLDELERREPQPMVDWLAAGALDPGG